MFWKKKKTDSEMFTLDTGNKRKLFRVCPADDRPIEITFAIGPAQDESTFHDLGEKKARVIDISAGGLSFSNGGFREKKSYPITFELPGFGVTISTAVQIVRIDREGICHCRFNELEDAVSDKIHEYVLERQKTNILRKKE